MSDTPSKPASVTATQCNCHLGSAANCPIHTQADFDAQDRICPTPTPEPHLLGAFPMSCYRCHVEADS